MATVKIADVTCDNVTAIVGDDTNRGALMCSQCDKNPTHTEWCRHKARLLQDNLDARQFSGLNKDADPLEISVPIFPTKNLWVRAEVVPAHTGMSEVALVIANHAAPGGLTFEKVHMGIIVDGEGRYAIRNLVIEWLRHKYTTVPFCPAPTHKARMHDPFSEAHLPNQLKRPPLNLDQVGAQVQPLIDTYFMLTKGACSKCAEYMDSSADVPEI